MTELAYIIAVALWCGQPIDDITVKQVQECRVALLRCVDKRSGKECFEKMEHPK